MCTTNYMHACIYQPELWTDQFNLVWMTFLCAFGLLVAHGKHTHTQHNSNEHTMKTHTHTQSFSFFLSFFLSLSLSHSKSACGQHRGWLQHGRSWPFAALYSTFPEGSWNEQKLCWFALFVWQICSCFYFLALSLHLADVAAAQTPWVQRRQRSSNLDSCDCDRFTLSHHDLLHHVKPLPRMWLFFVVATPLSSCLEANSMVHAECLAI